MNKSQTAPGSIERTGERLARMEPGRILALAALVSAVLFGLAGLVGAFGYLISVSRYDR